MPRFTRRFHLALRVLALTVAMCALLWQASTPAVADSIIPPEIEQALCDATEWYCDLAKYVPDIIKDLLKLGLDIPEPDFLWNPALPYIGKNDHSVITAVDMPTCFWLHEGDVDLEYVIDEFLDPRHLYIQWIYLHANHWCFGDGHLGFSVDRLPAFRLDFSRVPVQWYDYSSYFEEGRTDDDEPGFTVTMATWWAVGIVGYVIPIPVPICTQYPVPVRQVESVLIPGGIGGLGGSNFLIPYGD